MVSTGKDPKSSPASSVSHDRRKVRLVPGTVYIRLSTGSGQSGLGVPGATSAAGAWLVSKQMPAEYAGAGAGAAADGGAGVLSTGS